ncbi:DUF5666 domain-containing protein [Rhodococcus sp. YH1]|uniref:DUF5666 domain-containing protein n=1 Tax=Rhodococcus sp. YH1 TaxID=89066 RepID=UPI001386ED01|nr:hypothetical protein [Rhodococcus sp. YH1]
MTNPHDPRTPQERAYSLDEGRADDARATGTGRTDPDADDTRVLHTADPTEAYGRPPANPTLVYPAYDPRFDPTAAPPNPTQAFEQPGSYGPQPQYTPTQQYAPTQQYTSAQQYPHTQQYGAAPPTPPHTGEYPALDAKPPRRRRWGLILLAAVALIVLAGFGGYLLSGGSGDDPQQRSAAAPTTTTTVPRPAPTTPAPTTDPAVPGLPFEQLPGGLGDVIGAAGTVVGTITANDGTSLTLSGMGGSSVTVRLTPETQIMSLAGSDPSALRVGDSVVAQGSPLRDGEMIADTVVSASLPSFGGPGN